jgi:hypothetical protein
MLWGVQVHEEAFELPMSSCGGIPPALLNESWVDGPILRFKLLYKSLCLLDCIWCCVRQGWCYCSSNIYTGAAEGRQG